MTKKSTKRSLAMSILSLVLCLAMLIGSTYAWFSDKAETGDVNITSGNLDVEVALSDPSKQLFEDVDKLEPGMMVKSQPFTVENAGTLALTYTLNVKSEATANSKDVNLTDVVKMKVVKSGDIAEDLSADNLAARQALWAKIGSTEEDAIAEMTTGVIYPAKDKNTGLTATAPATQGKTDDLVAILFWNPTDNDNDYNLEQITDSDKIEAKFELDVFATQTPAEKDSFGDQYDTGLGPVDVSNEKELLDAVQKGGTLELQSDIDLLNDELIVDGNDVTIDLNGNNLSMSLANSGLSIKNGANVVLTGNGVIKNDKPVTDGPTDLITVKTGTDDDKESTLTLDCEIEVNNENNNARSNTQAICVGSKSPDHKATVNVTENGKITMKAAEGRAIEIEENGVVNMSGGEINIISTGEPDAGNCAFGVEMWKDSATFNMTGGKITVAGRHAASGVCAQYHGNINMSGGIIDIISENAEGGLYTANGIEASGTAKVKMTGGTINVKSTITGTDQDFGHLARQADAILVGTKVDLLFDTEATINVDNNDGKNNFAIVDYNSQKELDPDNLTGRDKTVIKGTINKVVS